MPFDVARATEGGTVEMWQIGIFPRIFQPPFHPSSALRRRPLLLMWAVGLTLVSCLVSRVDKLIPGV